MLCPGDAFRILLTGISLIGLTVAWDYFRAEQGPQQLEPGQRKVLFLRTFSWPVVSVLLCSKLRIIMSPVRERCIVLGHFLEFAAAPIRQSPKLDIYLIGYRQKLC